MLSDKKITNNPLPLTVSIEPNNICNAKCSFCAYGKEKRVLEDIRADERPILDKRPKQHITPKILDHVFNMCEKSGAGVLRKFSISPNFGEVSVSRNWVDMIKRAKSNCGIDNVSSYTNAITLNRTGIDNLINSGIDNLEISTSLVDRDSYKRLYGRDKYDQVMNNIIELLSKNKKAGFPIDIYINLRIDLPIDDFLASDIYSTLVEYIEERKISYLTSYDTFGGTIKDGDLPVGAVFIDRKNNKGKPPCSQLYKTLYVNIDGEIQACKCIPHPSLSVGNILDYNTLESAWRNSDYERIRNNWGNDGILPEACVTCTHYTPYYILRGYYSYLSKVRSYIRSAISGTFLLSFYKEKIKRNSKLKVSDMNNDY
jgi:radical SAM protein with 4Fe4S-binding SPASM domain